MTILWEQEVAGSNPAAPINRIQTPRITVLAVLDVPGMTTCLEKRGGHSRLVPFAAWGSGFLPPTPMSHAKQQRPSAWEAEDRLVTEKQEDSHPLLPAPGSTPNGASALEGVTLEQLDLWHAEFAELSSSLHGKSEATIRAYVDAYRGFRRFLLDPAAHGSPAFAERLLAVESWLMWNRRRGVGPVSCNTYWRSLRSFFRYLDQARQIPNPFRGLRAPGLPERVPKALSPEDCRRLLSAARNYPWPTDFDRVRAVALIATMLYTGIRRGELLRLEYADVDVRDGTIRVVRGKGRHGGKTRVCVIPPELSVLLRAYVSERSRLGFVCPEFFTSRQRRGLSLKQLLRIMECVKRAAGVRGVSPHALRHSFVSMALRAGISIHVVQAMAGHSSIESTIPYIRVFDAEKVEAAKRLRFER